jgi:hypothetical protein
MFYMCKPVEETCVETRRGDDGEYPAEMLPALIGVRLLDVPIFTTGLTFLDQTTREIVGVDTTCYVGQVTGDGGGAIDHGEVCLSDGGVPLLVTAAGAPTTMSIAATAAPREFDASAFELPYALVSP